MRQQDCSQVSCVVCSSFTWGARNEGFTSERIQDYISERGSENVIRNQFHEYQCLVACLGGHVVGMVAVEGNEITKLYVDPRFLRQKIGTKLFKATEEISARAGHEELMLGTVFDASIPFYEAMGMSKLGRKSVACGPIKGADTMLLNKRLLL